MIHSISCTTRRIRSGEKNGKDYHFISQEAFQERIEKKEFAEWAKVHGEFYGTPKGFLDKALEEGRDVLLDLDVQGGLNLKKIYGEEATTIFLLPPSQEELERRLSRRGTDSPAVQKVRLENARQELTFKDRYDYQVVNDDLERACQQIQKLIK